MVWWAIVVQVVGGLDGYGIGGFEVRYIVAGDCGGVREKLTNHGE